MALKLRRACATLVLVSALAAAGQAKATIVNYDLILTAGIGLGGSGFLSVDESQFNSSFAVLSPSAAVPKLTVAIGTQNLDLSNTFGFVEFIGGDPFAIVAVDNVAPVNFSFGGSTYSYSGPNGEAGAGTFSFSLAAAVPEPSTWAMMILGFAGIGAMTYRRRKSSMLAA
jgi:PEP-CTERM motif